MRHAGLQTARGLALAACVAGLPGLAAAGALDPGACYRRVYSAQHLAAQPAQSVRMLELLILPMQPGSPDRAAQVRAEFRDAPELFHAWLICPEGAEVTDGRRGALACFVECDGGGFEAWAEPAGNVILRTRGFLVEGSCGEPPEDGEDMPEVRWVRDAGAERTAYRLAPADPATCPPPPTE
ncbi:hypothetical protein LNKW23_32740 [Paralimibaculum aggregatum]|uniref:DUF3617 domain-containing protein n=1 Tax=Paralimibaculum aggregatum TaxID=3036245 RepID=A0ABQ6LLI6_9RHOB|nr:hypothetical protein [Limibaculum sp. NKW23]GMG84060.1 hypothetical protein LNKW23_32740 [Limibaculum sp. NKW23]